MYGDGGSLIAMQQYGSVEWTHTDPVTKGQQLRNTAGTWMGRVEVDPWGGETNRSSNSYRQPRKFTTYTRDGNASDEAMHRRYNRWWSRFDQPDPYDGSYSLADPQSFNRYSYVQNDPVNWVDRNGLWPTSIHNQIINNAFQGLTEREKAWIRQGSLTTDVPWTMFEGHANEHAMRKPGQTVEQARSGWQQFINGGNARAQVWQRDHEKAGLPGYSPTALQFFGASSHAVMDNTSPAHAGFQLFAGPRLTGNQAIDAVIMALWLKEQKAHSDREATITPEQMEIAVSAVRHNFLRTFGEERYRQAVRRPGNSAANQAFFILNMMSLMARSSGGCRADACITISASGRQTYTGGRLKPY